MFKLNFIFLISLSFLISTYTLAQNFGKVSGWVTDSASGNSIKDVNVLIKGTNNGTTTDSLGYFQLTLPAGKNYTIVFSHIACDNKVKKILLNKSEEVEYNIVLKFHLIKLPEVYIKGKKSFQDERSSFTIDQTELEKAGGNDLEIALNYLCPGVLYKNWSSNNKFSLKNNTFNSYSINFTLYVNGKLRDSSELDEIKVDKIKYIRMWKARPGVDMSPIDMPVNEGNFVMLIVTK